jgi:D-alanyl-D-alanine carboxypeptidase
MAFGRFLQDQLRQHSVLITDDTRARLYEQQRTLDGKRIAMTLGWHIASTADEWYYYKEGGGGGYHSMMRLYPRSKLGMCAMCNATAFDVRLPLDAAFRAFVKRS